MEKAKKTAGGTERAPLLKQKEVRLEDVFGKATVLGPVLQQREHQLLRHLLRVAAENSRLVNVDEISGVDQIS